MHNFLKFTGFIIIIVLAACKKDSATSNNNCYADAATIREITNEKAVIIKSGDEFVITEEGTIDTQLKPCNLGTEFQVDGLNVTISGHAKAIDSRICCFEGLEITKISR